MTNFTPINPNDSSPRYDDGSVQGVGYNTSGFMWLDRHLLGWGSSVNLDVPNGTVISADDCRFVADAIERNLSSLTPEHQDWLRPHIPIWRHSGGMRVW